MAEYPFLRTANGEDIVISPSFGVSSFDGLLRIWIPNSDLVETMMKFLSPNQLPITIHEDPEIEPTDFSEYTVFRGAELDFNNNVMLVLGRI